MTIYTCPVCGKDLVEMCYPTFPPQYGVECFNCGYKEITHQDTINRIPFKSKKKDEIDKLAEVFNEHFAIPCDMCQKYFNMKNNSCPPEVVPCNVANHWKLLSERIMEHEED